MLKILLDRKHQIIISAVILVIVVSIFTKGFTEIKPSSSKAVAQKGLEFIKETVLSQSPNSKIELISSEKYHGVVKSVVNIDGEKVELYITNDGKIGFLQPLIIDKTLSLEKYKKTNEVDVKLFTMSYCPFGNDAENVIIPVQNLLKDNIDIEPHYVIYSNYPSKEEQKNYC